MIRDLEVGFADLSRCALQWGWRMHFEPQALAAIHYNLSGSGRLRIDDNIPIALCPDTLIIVPRGCALTLEAKACDDNTPFEGTLVVRAPHDVRDASHDYIAGAAEPSLSLICGHFRALFGGSIELFSHLQTVMAGRFEADDQVEKRLRCALVELSIRQTGAIAMSNASLKQVLILLLRRSLQSPKQWTERFAGLADPQVARALSAMLALPGLPHSLRSLSKVAGLSRSAFIARFVAAYAESPMTMLRKLRLRRARVLLQAGALTLDEIAKEVGFPGRGSFYRALRNAEDEAPQDGLAVCR